MKLIFMGTPDFSVGALKALIEAGHEIQAVVTQPDKPKGRGKAVLMTPVKEVALEHGIPVYQPVRIRKEPEFIETLRAMEPDAMVVVAFGQILPKEVLDIPRYGCVNIHASLLPKYRGAAPIQWAVIDGERESGVTTMLMDEGLDTGDMLEKAVVVLDEKETGGSLHDKLSEAGGRLIVSTLKKLEEGTAVRTPQGETPTAYARMLDKSLGDIDWTMDAAAIERLIRGLNPWPSAYTSLDGKTLKIWAADVLAEGSDGEPGEVLRVGKDAVFVKTGEGTLAIKELQPGAGRRIQKAITLR